MTERDRGDDDASDWLSRQFGAGSEESDEPDEPDERADGRGGRSGPDVHDEPDDGADESDAGGALPPPRRASVESFSGGPGVPAAPPPAVAAGAPDPAPRADSNGFVWGLRPRSADSAAADGSAPVGDPATPADGATPLADAADTAAPGSAADSDDATQAMPAPGFDPRAAATDPSAIARDPHATEAMPAAGFDERAAATPVSIEPALDGRPGAEPVGPGFTGLVGGVTPTIADPAPPADADAPTRRRSDDGGRWHPTPAQKRLLWAAGALLAVIALVGLYLLGTRLRPAAEPTPTPSATPSETPTPTPTPTVEPPPVAAGPLPAGVHEWDALQGGECLAPFASAWEEEFTVVDCATPHPAQLVDRGTFPSEADAAYPGVEALQSQINLLCTPPSVIDFGAAAQYPDVVVQGAYPVTAEEWDEGYRDYFCFVTRSSGETFVGSIAVPQG